MCHVEKTDSKSVFCCCFFWTGDVQTELGGELVSTYCLVSWYQFLKVFCALKNRSENARGIKGVFGSVEFSKTSVEGVDLWIQPFVSELVYLGIVRLFIWVFCLCRWSWKTSRSRYGASMPRRWPAVPSISALCSLSVPNTGRCVVIFLSLVWTLTLDRRSLCLPGIKRVSEIVEDVLKTECWLLETLKVKFRCRN